MVDNEIRLRLDADEARRELRSFQTAFQRAGSDIRTAFGTDVGASLDGLVNRLGGASVGITSFGGAAGAAAAGVASLGAALTGATAAAFAFTQGQASIIREQRQFATNLGVSVEQFDALTQVAAQFGATSEDVSDGLKDLSVRAVENEKEFTELGISVRDTQGRLLQGIPLYLQVSDGIRGIADATSQAAAADILASDAGVRQIEVLRLGSEEIRRRTGALIEGGTVLTQQTALLEDEFTQALRLAGVETQTLRRIFAEELLPVFTPLLTAFNEFVRLNRDEIRAAALIGADAIAGLTDVFLASAQGAVAFTDALLDVPRVLSLPGWLGAFDGAEQVIEGTGTAIAGFREELARARAQIEDLQNFQGPLPETPAPTGGRTLDLGADTRTDQAAAARKRFLDSLLRDERSLLTEREQIQIRFEERFIDAEKRFSGRQLEAVQDRLSALEFAEIDALNDREAAREEAEAKALQARKDALIAQVSVREADPAARIRAEEEAKLEALREGLDEQLLTVEEAARLRFEIEAEAARQLNELERQAARQQQQIIRGNVESIIGATQALLGTVSGFAQQRASNEIAALEATGASEEVLAAERDRINREAFEQQKAIKLVEAVISTAAGVARAFADYPFPASAVIGGLVAAAGAVQIATIGSAQPASSGAVSAPSPAAPPVNDSFRDSRPTPTETADAPAERTVVTVNFNAPRSSRRARRELEEVLA